MLRPLVTSILALAFNATASAIAIAPGQTVVPDQFAGSVANVGIFERVDIGDGMEMLSGWSRNGTTSMTFYYQVSNVAPSMHGNVIFRLSGYAGLPASVSFRTDGVPAPLPRFELGSISPVSASRSDDGGRITFDFGTSLALGSTSHVFTITTDYLPNIIGTAGGGIGTSIDGGATFPRTTLAIGIPLRSAPSGDGGIAIILIAAAAVLVASRRDKLGQLL